MFACLLNFSISLYFSLSWVSISFSIRAVFSTITAFDPAVTLEKYGVIYFKCKKALLTAESAVQELISKLNASGFAIEPMKAEIYIENYRLI